jgi:hypothetical protein
MNVLHIIGKELAAELRDELPNHLVAAHPAGDSQLTLTVKLREDKKNAHKFQICKHGTFRMGRELGPTEYVIHHQYHEDRPMVFDIQLPDSLDKLHKWVRQKCGVPMHRKVDLDSPALAYV